MALSRRRFLSRLAGVPLAPRLAWEGSARAGRSLCPLPAPQSGIPAVLLDPGRHGVLHESYLGFVRGLAAAGFEARTAQAGAVPFSSLLIVPGATLRSAAFAAEICAYAMRGTRVLYECGAAYTPPEVFAAEQRLLHRHFNVRIRPPLHLWPGAQAGPEFLHAPYVRYGWPIDALVRDFSRAVPLAEKGLRPVAALGDMPVACLNAVGRGSFIFLGSPLGPHLLAGDRAAHAWLEALLSA